MKGLIFIYLMTAVGIFGGLAEPVIGLFTYIGFATLRPQFLWGFAGDLGGISQYVAIAMFIGWALKSFGMYSLRRVLLIAAPLIFFALWTFISAQFATNTVVANSWAIEFLKILAPFLVGITTINSTKHARWLLWLIVGSHAYIGYVMNMQYYVAGFNEVADLGFGGMDNNSFGLSLVCALGPAIGLALSAKKLPERGLAFASIVLILHTILLTYSRGAMVGLIAAMVAMFVILPKRPSYLAAVVVVALLGLRLAGPQVVGRFGTAFADQEERDSSAQSRVELWSACWDMATKNPLFGVGPRNFPVHAAEYGFTVGKEAHSTWMQTLAEMGFPGFTALLMFFVMALVKLWPKARQKWTDANKEETLLAAGILSSLAGFFVSAQFVTMVGLETIYYIVMAGAILIGQRNAAAQTVSLPAPIPAPALPPGPSDVRARGPLPEPAATFKRPSRIRWDAQPSTPARQNQA